MLCSSSGMVLHKMKELQRKVSQPQCVAAILQELCKGVQRDKQLAGVVLQQLQPYLARAALAKDYNSTVLVCFVDAVVKFAPARNQFIREVRRQVLATKGKVPLSATLHALESLLYLPQDSSNFIGTTLTKCGHDVRGASVSAEREDLLLALKLCKAVDPGYDKPSFALLWRELAESGQATLQESAAACSHLR